MFEMFIKESKRNKFLFLVLIAFLTIIFSIFTFFLFFLEVINFSRENVLYKTF